MLLEGDGFAARAGKGVYQASETLSVAAESLYGLARAEMAEGAEELDDGDLQGGLVELAGIHLGKHVQPGLLVGAHVVQPLLILEKALVAWAAVPVGYIFVI